MIATKLLQLLIRRVSNKKLNRLFEMYSFGISGVVLLGAVAGAGYAGTSILFVGYLTGMSANYLFPHHAIASYEGLSIFYFSKADPRYFESVTNWLLVPFFFVVLSLILPLMQGIDGFCDPCQDTIYWSCHLARTSLRRPHDARDGCHMHLVIHHPAPTTIFTLDAMGSSASIISKIIYFPYDSYPQVAGRLSPAQGWSLHSLHSIPISTT
jgi:hypothetical protein